MTPSPIDEAAHEAGKRIHHFHGGLRLRHNKKISCRDPVERPPLPDLLIVPLLQQAGDIAEALATASVMSDDPIGIAVRPSSMPPA